MYLNVLDEHLSVSKCNVTYKILLNHSPPHHQYHPSLSFSSSSGSPSLSFSSSSVSPSGQRTMNMGHRPVGCTRGPEWSQLYICTEAIIIVIIAIIIIIIICVYHLESSHHRRRINNLIWELIELYISEESFMFCICLGIIHFLF